MNNRNAAERIRKFLEVFPDAKAPDVVKNGQVLKNAPPGSVLVVAPRDSDPSDLIKELKEHQIPGFLRFLDPADPWLEPDEEMFPNPKTQSTFERRYQRALKRSQEIGSKDIDQ